MLGGLESSKTTVLIGLKDPLCDRLCLEPVNILPDMLMLRK